MGVLIVSVSLSSGSEERSLPSEESVSEMESSTVPGPSSGVCTVYKYMCAVYCVRSTFKCMAQVDFPW